MMHNANDAHRYSQYDSLYKWQVVNANASYTQIHCLRALWNYTALMAHCWSGIDIPGPARPLGRPFPEHRRTHLR